MPKAKTRVRTPRGESVRCSSVVLGCGLLLSVGCAVVGPNFVGPRPPVAEAWHEARDEMIRDEPANYGAWWEAFDDGVLNTLIDSAYMENLTLQVAAIRVLEARARLGVAGGLRAPQKQELGGQAVRVQLSENGPNLAIADRSFWDYQLGFDAVWELDFWGRFRRGIEAANAGYLATIAGYDEALVTVTADRASRQCGRTVRRDRRPSVSPSSCD